MGIKQVNDEEKSWFIDWVEQYSQFFRNDNWYTYNFAHIEFEWDKIMGGLEFTFILLGLGLRWRWNYTVTEKMQECMDMMAEVKKDQEKK